MSQPNAFAPYAEQSEFSDPGAHVALVAAVAPEPRSIHRAVTTTIAHYRADPVPPTAEQLADIDRRWVSSILDAAVARCGGPLDAPRAADERVAGCCRDHSLVAVSILREHGVPARTRLGFAGYFTPGYRHDHVVVEYRDGDRWRRFDPELDAADDRSFDPHDLPVGEGSPFEVAAEAWLAFRAGRTDLASYGVAPGVPVAGPAFVHSYVLGDLAHRMRAELLLWDGWGAMATLGEPVPEASAILADRIAELTIAADRGDAESEAALAELWRTDERVRPGRVISTFPPSGRIGTTDLEARTSEWATPAPAR